MQLKVYLSGLRHSLINQKQFFVTALGIILAVAAIISIDLAIQSSKKAFELSSKIVVGNTTHQIIGSSSKINQQYYVDLLSKFPHTKMAPVIDDYINIGDSNFKVFGIDPLVEKDFRSNLRVFSSDSGLSLNKFISSEPVFICSLETAEDLGIKIGDKLHIPSAHTFSDITLIAIIESKSDLDANSIRNFLIVDISTAQDLLSKLSSISRIDLIIKSDEELHKIQKYLSTLSSELKVVPSSSYNKSMSLMTKSFHTNLSALSLLAMLVGIFLIYNAVNFSILQRRKVFSIFRCLGVTDRQIFISVLIEEFILGLIGSAFGLILGMYLGKFLLTLVVQTINDLYFSLSVTEVYLNKFSLYKGFFIGIFSSLVAAIVPAIQASKVSPLEAANKVKLNSNSLSLIPQFNTMAVLFFVISYIFFVISKDSIEFSFAGLFAMVIGFALLSPMLIVILVPFFNLVLKKYFGFRGAYASKSIRDNINRTAISVAALMVAFSLQISLSIAVQSFRMTVEDWLKTSLKADYYVTAPKIIANKNSESLNKKIITSIKDLTKRDSEIESISFYREIEVESRQGKIHLAGVSFVEQMKESFEFLEADDNLWERFLNNEGIIITQPFAYKNSLNKGDKVDLLTKDGYKSFEVLGVFYDYSSDLGIAMINLESFRDIWDDNAVNSFSIYLNKFELSNQGDDFDFNEFRKNKLEFIKNEFARNGIRKLSYEIYASSQLMSTSLEVFDRTFKVTDVLKYIAIIVALFGSIAALTALIYEKSNDFAIFRALGCEDVDMTQLLSLEVLVMVLISLIGSIPLGIAEAWIMIYVINHRSFGWSINFDLNASIFLTSLLIALVATIVTIAFTLPRFKKVQAAELLRN